MGHLQLGDVRRCFDWLNVFNAVLSSEVIGSGRDPGRMGWRETIPYDSSHSCYRLFRSTPILLQLFRSTPILLQIISFYTYLVTGYFVLHLYCYRLFRSTPITTLTHAVTPSLPQPTNFQAERRTDVTANSMFSGPVTSTFKVLLFHD